MADMANEIKTKGDATLLRPLYLATSVSPVCLLHGVTWTGDGTNRIPMPFLVAVRCAFFAPYFSNVLTAESVDCSSYAQCSSAGGRTWAV